MTPQPSAALQAFMKEFESRSRMHAASGPNGLSALRMCWIGTGPKHWCCLATTEEAFDEASAISLGAKANTSAPWAHAANTLGAMMQAALASIPGLRFSTPDLFASTTSENSFACPRMRNSMRFAILEEGSDLDGPAMALGLCLPGSWAISSQGMELPDIPKAGGAIARLDFSEDDYLSSGAGAPHPQKQVDDEGQVHWLWLPAAARALGAPASLSISARGIDKILGWGDILGEANRLAANDPEKFRSQFAEALIQAEKNPSERNAKLAFMDRDRRCALSESTPQARAASLAAPRL